MNNKKMNAMFGGLTALCMACTMMSNNVAFAQENTFEVINENTKETSKPDWESEAAQDKTVFYNGQYFSTTDAGDMKKEVGAIVYALKAAYMDTSTTGVKEIHCKPNADVGTMTHGHVADDLIIYGNGAYVSSGERDLEVDMYKYDRSTGNQSDSGQYLEKDITVTVKNLDGIAAWGNRNTNHKVTLVFEDCDYMQRIYFNGTAGDIDITVKNCSFDGNGNSDGNLKGNPGTSIYSNANGTINIENCEFNNIDVALNMNHKAAGPQSVNVKNTTFTDCGRNITGTTSQYAAPIRIVASANDAKSNLNVDDCNFTYTDGKTNCGNGDILIGDGRSGENNNGTVTLSMSETNATVMAQEPGYYANGQTDSSKAAVVTVKENEVVNDQTVTVDKPVQPQPAPESGTGGGGGSTVEVNPVYRAYNPNNGEHLYTLDEKEYKHVSSIGWTAEGVAFMAETEKNGQALYRVYNPNDGLHHYTTDENEKNILVSLGWHDEKVAWYTSKKPQSAPVFRVYNPNDGNHHYTMSQQEKDTLVVLGWKYEGIAFRTAPIEK